MSKVSGAPTVEQNIKMSGLGLNPFNPVNTERYKRYFSLQGDKLFVRDVLTGYPNCLDPENTLSLELEEEYRAAPSGLNCMDIYNTFPKDHPAKIAGRFCLEACAGVLEFARAGVSGDFQKLKRCDAVTMIVQTHASTDEDLYQELYSVETYGFLAKKLFRMIFADQTGPTVRVGYRKKNQFDAMFHVAASFELNAENA